MTEAAWLTTCGLSLVFLTVLTTRFARAEHREDRERLQRMTQPDGRERDANRQTY